MSKFCGQCGFPIPDGAKKCSFCEAQSPERKGRKKLMIGVALCAVVLIAVGIIFFFNRNTDYTDAIDRYVAVQYKGEKDKIETSVPYEYWEYLGKKYDLSPKDVIDRSKKLSGGMLEKNNTVKYEITETTPLSETELEELKSTLKYAYHIARKTVTEAYRLKIDFTVAENEQFYTVTEEVSAVKIDGEWYLCDLYDGVFLPSF